MTARRAGVSVPLFSLRSSRSWGIGEIGDLPFAASWLRAAGQSVLQILPLNELSPGQTSPYSALSAMAIDPRYISIWMLEEAVGFEILLRDEIEAARQSPRVDHGKVLHLKDRALRASFERFYQTEWLRDTDRAASFRAYVSAESWWLDDYSLYRALRAAAGERPWTEWPAGARDRQESVLTRLRAKLSKAILFHQYLQWVAADQWRTVRRSMDGIQILGDLPFMVTEDSADVWSRQKDFILDASVGTPPDAFSETGQQWGLPPYNWEEARTNDFAWLRIRVRRLADLCDGFRVDHLVGFYRTFVRPLDGRPAFFLPSEESEQRELGETLMRIMIATGADISVEDLGTVPPFVRESITRLGLPGYKVLRWEPDPPTQFPPISVAMTGTHDTEPLALWWRSLSAEERQQAGYQSPVFDATVRDGILASIYHSGSNLVLLPIQDIFGWADRVNEPGTVGETNWTYALPWPVDQLDRQPEALERAHRLLTLSYRTGRWRPRESGD